MGIVGAADSASSARARCYSTVHKVSQGIQTLPAGIRWGFDLPYLDRVWFGFTQKMYSDVPPGDMASLELFDIGPAHPAEGLLGPSMQRRQGAHGGLQLEQLSVLHRDLARDLL